MAIFSMIGKRSQADLKRLIERAVAVVATGSRNGVGLPHPITNALNVDEVLSIPMTERLEHAIDEVKKLSEVEQDVIASLILDRIADDLAWDQAFSRSQDQLVTLATKARADIAGGRVHPLRPSKR